MRLTLPMWPSPEASAEIAIVNKYKRLMPVATAYADCSKYPGTHVGAAIFGASYEPLSAGWNGAPRGCKAEVDGRGVEREERLKWTVHAEANAIANAARSGAKLEGSTILVTHAPCLSCASLIVQAGIKRVICPRPDDEFMLRWGGDIHRSRRLLRECGVNLIEFDTTEGSA